MKTKPSNKEKTTLKCYLCDEVITGHAYNVWPFVDESDPKEHKCCEECDKKEVQPAIKALARLYDAY